MAVNEKTTLATSAIAASKPRNKAESRRLWSILFGDVLVFIIFAVIGRQSHGEDTGLTAFFRVIWTALPFALGWFIISPFVGAFRRELMGEPRKMAKQTLLAWIASWPLGLFLHFVFEWRMPTVTTVATFGLVSLLFNALVLLVWRVPFAMNNHTKAQQGELSSKK